MKKIDLGQTVSILANLGVIAGIAFLAVELQQNNRLLSAQAEYNLLQNRGTIEITQNAELAAFWFKVNSGAELDGTEEFRVEAFIVDALANWQWEYGQYRAGDIDLEELPVAFWRAGYHGQGLRRLDKFPEVWDRLRSRFNPDFAQFIQENVVAPGPP